MEARAMWILLPWNKRIFQVGIHNLYHPLCKSKELLKLLTSHKPRSVWRSSEYRCFCTWRFLQCENIWNESKVINSFFLIICWSRLISCVAIIKTFTQKTTKLLHILPTISNLIGQKYEHKSIYVVIATLLSYGSNHFKMRTRCMPFRTRIGLQ